MQEHEDLLLVDGRPGAPGLCCCGATPRLHRIAGQACCPQFLESPSSGHSRRVQGQVHNTEVPSTASSDDSLGVGLTTTTNSSGGLIGCSTQELRINTVPNTVPTNRTGDYRFRDAMDDTIIDDDDMDQSYETDWIPSEWIGCGKKYPDIPPISPKQNDGDCAALAVRVAATGGKIGAQGQKIFGELVAEKEVLAKAVASLNTVRKKGKANIHIMELPEDEYIED
ncbi:hypothetical protein DFH09DRAFT_1101406 [Mycena vulgaris]|nr:hypothetical protein DFH09DRAFT_1101406 [Mycena vulgaris]